MSRRLNEAEMAEAASRVFRFGAGLMLLAVAATIAGVWWWAIAGMSEQIATALQVTVLVVFVVGGVAVALGIAGGGES